MLTRDQEIYRRRKSRSDKKDLHTGDWDIIDLPEDEYQEEVRRRVEEYRRTMAETGQTLKPRSYGYHRNARPDWRPSEMVGLV